RTYEQVFEVETGLAEEGREVMKEEREAGDVDTTPRDHDFGMRTFAKQRFVNQCLGRDRLVAQSLEIRELVDQLEDDGNVGGSRGGNRERCSHEVHICIVKAGDIFCRPE